MSAMEGETLHSRVLQLIQRTRKAVRLYSSAERSGRGEQAEFSGLQLDQWQSVNTELQRQLASAVDHPNQKLLPEKLLSIRDRFHHDWRDAETEAHGKQSDLMSASEKGDFVRAAIVSRTLVSLKAREQATQAAHHELQELIDRCKVSSQSSSSYARGQRSAQVEMPGDSNLLEQIEALSSTDSDSSTTDAGRISAQALPAKPQAKIFQLRSRHGS